MKVDKFLEKADAWCGTLDGLVEELHQFADDCSKLNTGHAIEHAGSIAGAALHIIEEAMLRARDSGEFIP